MERGSREEAHVVWRSLERHEVVDPGGGRQRTELAVLGIDDQVEPATGHSEPAGFLEAPEGVVRGDAGRPECPLCLDPGERVPAPGQEPFRVCPSLRLHSFIYPSYHRYFMQIDC